MIGVDMGRVVLQLEKVPGGVRFLDWASGVENDRQSAGAQIGDGMPMSMAVEIKADSGVSLNEGAEALAMNEAMLRFAVLEEREVVEQQD